MTVESTPTSLRHTSDMVSPVPIFVRRVWFLHFSDDEDCVLDDESEALRESARLASKKTGGCLYYSPPGGEEGCDTWGGVSGMQRPGMLDAYKVRAGEGEAAKACDDACDSTKAGFVKPTTTAGTSCLGKVGQDKKTEKGRKKKRTRKRAVSESEEEVQTDSSEDGTVRVDRQQELLVNKGTVGKKTGSTGRNGNGRAKKRRRVWEEDDDSDVTALDVDSRKRSKLFFALDSAVRVSVLVFLRV